MEILDPAVRLGLCRWQAGARGGGCGTNVQRVFRHISGGGLDAQGAPFVVGPLWRQVFGPAANAAREKVRDRHVPALAHMPAVFFADQAKAFERLSVTWLGRVLGGWRLPPWLRRAAMSLVQGRAVCASVGGRLGPQHQLIRSVGMGGTCSCFCWNVAYDPITKGLSDTRLQRPLMSMTLQRRLVV